MPMEESAMTRHIALQNIPVRELRALDDILARPNPPAPMPSLVVVAEVGSASRDPEGRREQPECAPFLNQWGIWSGL
jgi:hypothetical protein